MLRSVAAEISRFGPSYSRRLPLKNLLLRRWAHSGTSSPRGQRYAKRVAYATLLLGGGWALDDQFNASAITRSVRTMYTFATIALDYKLNFTPEKSEQIPELHERVADRVYNLLTGNGGLYIKLGQAIGNNAALLPQPLQDKFAKLFDDAPQVSYEVVRSVLKAEFDGREPAGPNGVFEIFEEQAVASASIAQVHRAKLRSSDGNGPWVAVKVKKPAVDKQVEWDLGAYRLVMWLYDWWFEMPVYFTVDFIADQLRKELDFKLEAMNAVETSKFVASDPLLSQRVHIPKVFPEYSTKRVMVMEWIDGVRLSDRRAILGLMGEKDPRRPNEPSPSIPLSLSNPLRGGVALIMDTMVQLFSAQIFSWGWVHCDPHPGNIIIRPHPLRPRDPQLVLLDHGLYVRLSDDFRRQYATLWRGLMTMNVDVIKDVAHEWGIGTPDLFASATLMKPVRFGNQKGLDKFNNMSHYERSQLIKQRLKGFLVDTDKMPKALVFIGRNMRIVQGNNQMLGSPVNRIRITGSWASRSLTRDPTLPFLRRVHEYIGYVGFLGVTWTIDAAFYVTKLRQWVWMKLGWTSAGFEDELEKTMRGYAKSSFGVEISESAFTG